MLKLGYFSVFIVAEPESVYVASIFPVTVFRRFIVYELAFGIEFHVWLTHRSSGTHLSVEGVTVN